MSIIAYHENDYIKTHVWPLNTQVSVSHKINLCSTSHSIVNSFQSPKADFLPVIQNVI